MKPLDEQDQIVYSVEMIGGIRYEQSDRSSQSSSGCDRSQERCSEDVRGEKPLEQA
jgi:hypothetical protein